MKRIIIHWTAGNYFPNNDDFEHYHFVIDKNGKVKEGKYKPEDNLNCYDGCYAAHTGGGNTGSIGVAVCGMRNFKGQWDLGDCPITQVQMEAMFKLVAELCKKYNIQINKNTVFTHYEFGLDNPNTSSKGKIDINFIPYKPELKSYQIGDYIRGKVIWYRERIK